jgi:hypothetical protein
MTQPNGESDQRSQAALDKTSLELFTVLLDRAEVAAAGMLPVAPSATATYWLSARAGRSSKPLGQVTVRVDLAACTTKTDIQVVKWVAGAVTEKIQERTDGVYLKTLIFGTPNAVVAPNPIVTITPDRMNLHLVLGKQVRRFPDPTITIDASFGLEVIPGPPPTTLGRVPLPFPAEFPPVLAPVDKSINTDVSFPWYAWTVPGAMLFLPIVTSGAEDAAHKSADSMIDEIVSSLLNSYFATPPNAWKQHVTLYVDDLGGEFAVTFCPAPQPQNAPTV